ncbi:DNA polymerase III subunit epsilon [Paracoccus sp. CPCC 101403]|uniref:DNA polymerase III subunit epsilon n=2 Tax=Paracoccus broussonetiae TaxID=3075834 RepID=A0ABU3EET0_9RHOB|nr:DNA polymerase III subunit epsilon [Paracoccus sp. CPCC 101403]MDT1062749.1 DNA polymerase III subunit epsilon [Paracoccus sp. CPCC 101403]
MREIVLDTETTGFDPETGDRIVEIGALELMNHLPTGRTFHVYINPERSMPQEAFEVHGLGDDFLRDKPVFATVARDFVEFIGEDSRLVIHNAQFDMKFLNAELRRAGHAVMPYGRAIDTLELARRMFPGAQNSLDALCRRFRVDNSNRTLHGALLDSELLAEVYLALRGGRQPGLVLEGPAGAGQAQGTAGAGTGAVAAPRSARPRPLAPRLTEAEAEAHAAFVGKMGEKALWLRYQPAGAAA